MKRFKKYISISLLLLLALNFFSCTTDDVTGAVPVSSDPVEIPDAAFGEYLVYLAVPGVYSEIDESGTTKYYLIPSEVNGVNELSLSKTSSNVATLQSAGVTTADVKITNLDGIQYFTSLETLVLTSNAIETLDVSQNTILKDLELNFNLIGNLDLSHNPALEILRYKGSANATASQKLSSIDLSNNTQLHHLYLPNHNIVSIDLSNNPLIDDTLDMSGNPGPDGDTNTGDIVVPAAIYNQVPAANRLGVIPDDGGTTEPVLYEIQDAAFGEYLVYLNIAGATTTTVDGVTHYYIDENIAPTVTELSLSKTSSAITTLQSAGLATADTPIANLDGIQYFTGLKDLTLTSNALTSLDVSALTELESLQMNFNLVPSLDVTHNHNLKKLRYQASSTATDAQKIATIDLSQNPLLYNINLRKQNLSTFTLDASVHVNFTASNLLSGDTTDDILIDVRDNPGADFTIPAAIYDQIATNSTASAPLQGVTE